MKYYALYNKKIKTYLNHPKLGLWNTNDLKEAQSMLDACQEYAKTFNVPDYENQFVIIDAETKEEIC